MRIYSLTLVWLLIGLIACTGSKNKELVSVEFSRVPEMIDSIIIDDNSSRIRNLSVSINGALMITDDDKYFIRKMEYPGFQCVDSGGVRGHGPDEWITVMVGGSCKSGELPVYDIMNKVVRLASITDSSLMISNYCELPLDEEGYSLPYGTIVRVSNGLWLAKENDSRGTKLTAIDLGNGEEYGEFIPDVKVAHSIKGYPNDDYCFAEDKGRIIVGYSKFNRVEIIDLNDMHQIGVIGESQFCPEEVFSLQAAAHGGFFYLLQADEGGSQGRIVRVFDREGNEESPIQLTRPASLIAFDSEDLLLGISETSDYNICYRYSLK